MNPNRPNTRTSWFYKLFLNNKVAIGLTVFLLVLLNLFLISKLSFIFHPIMEFLAIIILPVVLAGIFYYILNPIVDFFERKGVSRTISIIVIFILLVGILIVSLAVVIPSMADHIESFLHNVPNYVNDAQKRANEIIKEPIFKQYRPQIEEFMNNTSSKLIDASRDFSKYAVSGVSSFLGKATGIFVSVAILPFILFYLLKDGENLQGYILQFVPDKWKHETGVIMSEVNTTLSNYVRGQVTVAFAVAVILSVFFSLIGLKYAVSIGIMAGILNLIPYLGSFVAFATALIVAGATGPSMVIKVILCFVVEQFIEGHLISPLVLGSKLNIHPVTILLVLLTSGKLFGLWGVLLGVPVYASIKVIVTNIFAWYRRTSGLYSDTEKTPVLVEDKK